MRGARPKLTPEQRAAIKAAPGKLKDPTLAKHYGVSAWTVYMIRSGKEADYRAARKRNVKQTNRPRERTLGDGRGKFCPTCRQEYRFPTDRLYGILLEECGCGTKPMNPQRRAA